MNKIALGALALTAATTPALATETSWSTTDRDLASLSSSLTQGASGVSVEGFLRSSYVGWSDQDVNGFSMDNAQIWIKGNVGDFAVVVQTEAASAADSEFDPQNAGGDFAPGSTNDTDPDDNVNFKNSNNLPFRTGSLGGLGVLDAYVTWNATEMIKVQMGNFRPAVLGSSLRNENQLLFINRSYLGSEFAFRDLGVQASGAFGVINFMVFAQNGDDGADHRSAFGGRAEATLLGSAGNNEGALGASNDPSLTLGVGYYEDQIVGKDSAAAAFDANFTMGALGLSAEIVDFSKDRDYALPFNTGFANGTPPTVRTGSDATPFNIAASFVVIPDQVELAVRYEDFDDSDSAGKAQNTTAITGGVNWYLQGHAAKWQFNYVSVSSDQDDLDSDQFQVGLTVSM